MSERIRHRRLQAGTITLRGDSARAHAAVLFESQPAFGTPHPTEFNFLYHEKEDERGGWVPTRVWVPPPAPAGQALGAAATKFLRLLPSLVVLRLLPILVSPLQHSRRIYSPYPHLLHVPDCQAKTFLLQYQWLVAQLCWMCPFSPLLGLGSQGSKSG